MPGHRDIELNDSSITNGRIYFSASDKAFFPSDSFGTRDGEEKGDAVTFDIVGEQVSSDIRLVSGQRISPRKSFARFIKALKAKSGDKWRVTHVDKRRYKIEPIAT
jgi:hypothetical protein